MAKILVVEDDADLSASISSWLEAERYVVDVSNDGAEALNQLQIHTYDVVILDWQLPAVEGIDVLREFRSRGGATAVLMLTGKSMTRDKTTGLDSGADDYLLKPVDLNELSARVRALLRRQPTVPQAITVGCLSLNPLSRQVLKNGAEIRLLPKEFELLEFFMKNCGHVFSTEALLKRLWAGADVSEDAVFTCVSRLRQKLEPADTEAYIRTIHGVGYKFAGG